MVSGLAAWVLLGYVFSVTHYVCNQPKVSSWLRWAGRCAAVGCVLSWSGGEADSAPRVPSLGPSVATFAAPSAGALPPEGDDSDTPVAATRAVPGQFVVRFRDGVALARTTGGGADLGPGIASIRWLARPRVGVQTTANAPRASVFDRFALVTAAPNEPGGLVLARLQRHPALAYAEPNTLLTLHDAPEPGRYPNDFRFSEQWSLLNGGGEGGQAGSDIRAPLAWTRTTGDPGIRVAVIDTGIDYYHPDLEANVWTNPGEIAGNGLDDDANGYIDDLHGYDFVSDDGDPMDDQIHGTHVAGTIGAVGDNEIGVAGVCWRTSLMALKAFNENGEGALFDVIAAIQYAAANGARVLNASWGQTDKSQALAEAIGEAHTRGLVIVAAAGNNRSETVSYPAAYSEAVTVAALNQRDRRSMFSSYGAHVDLAAPGESILSTIPDNRFELASGTSMAAPHVTGAAALVLSRHPEFTHTQVEDILRNAVDPLSGSEYVGAGRLNLWRAVQVEIPLPTARLALPTLLTGQVDLWGTAAGAHFAGYALEYGQGVYPTNWTRLHAGEAPVEQGPLLTGWNSASLPEGNYVFRLTVRDRWGQEARERAKVTIRNVHLASPSHNDVLRAGEVIPLTGTVFGAGRTYTLAHGIGRDPSAWSTDGILLADGGQSGVIAGLLGTWDTRAVEPDNFYTLKLTAWANGEAIGTWTSTLVYLDQRLRPGWPQYVTAPTGYSTNDWRQIAVADLDTDGAREILVMEAGNQEGKTARLLVYGLDGRLRWTRELPAGVPTADLPTVGDLDGDGFSEVLVDTGDTGEVWAFHHDGRPLEGAWPVLLGAANLGKVLADLDQDGTPELVVCGRTVAFPTPQRLLAVIDRHGQVRQRWYLSDATPPLDVPRQFPAVGDLDDDPELEIVAVSGESDLALLDLSQPERPVWQVRTPGFFYASPVVGDVDGDQRAEIVLASYDAAANGKTGTRGGVFVFDRFGQVRPGWPVLIDESFAATPALGDLDRDGGLDIVAVNWEKKLIHLLRFDGFDLPGWPVGPIMANNSTAFPMLGLVKSMPLVGDVDGDDWPDVVAITPGLLNQAAMTGDVSFFGGVKAWSRTGRPIDLHPRSDLTALIMECGSGSRQKAAPPVLTDLDGNGRLDVVASTVEDYGYGGRPSANLAKGRYSLYAWELGVPCVATNLVWPMFQRDPARTGCLPSPKPQNLPPEVEGIPSQTIRSGSVFFPIELDRYVADPDHPTSALSWRVEGAADLLVTLLSNRVVIVAPPTPAWAGAETLRLVARDPAGLEAAALATFSVRVDYDPPLAVADAGALDEDTALELEPLVNDSHPRGLPLEVLQVSRAHQGQVELLPDSRLCYLPKADFFGEDSFSYLVGDGQGGMAMAWVRLEVRPRPDPPTAVEDRAITLEDTPLAIDPLANDTDPDGDVLHLVDFTQPANGTVEVSPDASLLYRPRLGWSGADTFGYAIGDGQGHEAKGVVVLQVKPVNDPPVAQDLWFTLNRNTSQDLIYSASDPDGDPLTFQIVKGPDHGELWAQPNVATYYPKPGFAGEDTITYVASDGAFTSPPALVRFTVLAVNNAPKGQPQSLVTKVGRPLRFPLLATDPDSDAISFSLVEGPAHGQVTLEATNALYTPEPDFLGEDRFAFTASDGQAASAPCQVFLRVTDQNTAPVAESYSLAVAMNAPTNLTLRATDGENDPLRFTVVTNPVHGVFSGTASEVTYTPQPGYYGPDRFAFTVHDGELGSPPGVVALAIVHPNHAPATTNQFLWCLRDAPTPFLLDVTDAEDDVLRAAILKGPEHGRVHGMGTNFVYVPQSGFAGGDSFTYRVWDGIAYSPIATVYVTVQTAPPPSPPRFEALKVLEDGALQMRIATTPRRLLEVQVSTNLSRWEFFQAVTPPADTITLLDTNAPVLPRRYYRALRRE